MQENVKILEEEMYPFQAEQSVLIPSVDDYLPNPLPVCMSKLKRVSTLDCSFPVAFISCHQARYVE